MTSGLYQLKSGCQGVNVCSYHWPGVPSASVTRVHAGPPKIARQLLGGSSPFGPLPSRNQYRARSGEPGPAVVGDDVEHDADAALFGGGHQPIEIVEISVHRLDIEVVGDVVAVIALRRREARRQP